MNFFLLTACLASHQVCGGQVEGASAPLQIKALTGFHFKLARICYCSWLCCCCALIAGHTPTLFYPPSRPPSLAPSKIKGCFQLTRRLNCSCRSVAFIVLSAQLPRHRRHFIDEIQACTPPSLQFKIKVKNIVVASCIVKQHFNFSLIQAETVFLSTTHEDEK